MERTYNIPLRKGFGEAARYKKTKKAVSTLKTFLSRHMKSDKILIGKHLNQALWKDGIKNPPHHVKVTVTKDADGTVKAELIGHKFEHKKKEQKEEAKQEAKPAEQKQEPKKETKTAPKAVSHEGHDHAGHTHDEAGHNHEAKPAKKE